MVPEVVIVYLGQQLWTMPLNGTETTAFHGSCHQCSDTTVTAATSQAVTKLQVRFAACHLCVSWQKGQVDRKRALLGKRVTESPRAGMPPPHFRRGPQAVTVTQHHRYHEGRSCYREGPSACSFPGFAPACLPSLSWPRPPSPA